MRKLIVPIAALGAALAAAPSTAQSYGYPGGGYGRPNDGQGYGGNRYMVPAPWQVRQMIDQAVRSGEVSRYEARRLYGDARDLDRLYDRAQRHGDDYRARQEWQRRTFEVLRELRAARNDGDGRYGYGDHDGRYPPPPPPGARPY